MSALSGSKSRSLFEAFRGRWGVCYSVYSTILYNFVKLFSMSQAQATMTKMKIFIENKKSTTPWKEEGKEGG
jgi:hypothetical protein